MKPILHTLQTLLQALARIAIILVASLIVVAATMAVAPASQTGDADFGQGGDRPAQGQFAAQTANQDSTGSVGAPGNLDKPGGERDHEGGEGSMGWGEVLKNLAIVGVIILPFAAVGALRRRSKVAVA